MLNECLPRTCDNFGFNLLIKGVMAVDSRTTLTCTKEIMEQHLPNCTFMPCPNTFHEIPWNSTGKINFDESEGE